MSGTERPRGAGRSTAIFAIWTGVSRVAGLAREVLAAILFGTQGAINAFVVAFAVPNLLRSLVADSALSAAFVPVFTQLEEQGRKAEARRLAGALAGVITLGLGGITLIAIVAAPWVMPFFAPGLPEELEDELVLLSQIMFPIVVLLGLTGLVAAILQAAGEFGATAFVPVLWNAVIIVALGLGGLMVDGETRITVYAVGILAGTLVQLLFLLPYLRGKGPFRLSLGLRNPRVRQVLVLMLPVTLGLGLINVNLIVDAAVATLVSDEAPRAIDAAFRLYLLPQGVFSVAIATVLFPAISRLAARDDLRGFRSTVAVGVRQIFFMLLPASAFLLVLSGPVVRLVFQYGEFDEQSTAFTSEALFFFALGLAFNGASLLVIRALFSLQRPWLPDQDRADRGGPEPGPRPGALPAARHRRHPAGDLHREPGHVPDADAGAHARGGRPARGLRAPGRCPERRGERDPGPAGLELVHGRRARAGERRAGHGARPRGRRDRGRDGLPGRREGLRQPRAARAGAAPAAATMSR